MNDQNWMHSKNFFSISRNIKLWCQRCLAICLILYWHFKREVVYSIPFDITFMKYPHKCRWCCCCCCSRKCQSDFVYASSCARLQKHVGFANILSNQWMLVVIAWVSIINSSKPKCRCQLHAIQPNMINDQSY